jgi:D-inositol-3-phosphate glycosyltransferase
MHQKDELKENPFCLVIIGGEAEESDEQTDIEMSRIKSLSEHYGLSDFVTFLGKRSQDSLPYYYSAAETVVVPSQYESFGMVALEAMACGKPVVASQIGGLAYLVQDGVTGFTVPVDDPIELANRISSLIKDKALRDRMGKQAFTVAQDYAWDKIASKLLVLYKSVLENSLGDQTSNRAGF